MKKCRYLILLLIVGMGCSDLLEEPVYSELSPENFLSSRKGIESVLAEAYSRAANMHGNQSQHEIKKEEMVTDIMFHSGGGEHGTASRLLDFSWDAQSNVNNTFMWGNHWDAIRNANIVIDNLDIAGDISDEVKTILGGEARFVRVYAYYQLWNQFGSVPLRTSIDDPLELPRATEVDFHSFMESELIAIIPDLPDPGEEFNYGRAHNGAARALLTKWYLNTYQWQKCADLAKEIMDNGHFALVSDYNEMFEYENERNSEFIWIRPALHNRVAARNTTLATAFPWDFQQSIDTRFPIVFSGWTNVASQYRLYDAFYNSFDPDDERKDRIITRYIDSAGDTVDLIEDYDDAIRGFKYPPDPNAVGREHGNDIPFIRYADILLSRAEALNELNGPNTESIDLINQIRNRAGLGNVALADFGSKEALRDHILRERGWEFWYEAKRRRDLIRMGKFIEYAHDRGITNADAHHILFPLPQAAIDANPLLEQNPDY